MNSINFSKNSANVNLDVVIFSEGEYRVAYSPALDLAGQGKSDHDAIAGLLSTVEITIGWARENGTIKSLLSDLGWVNCGHKLVHA